MAQTLGIQELCNRGTCIAESQCQFEGRSTFLRVGQFEGILTY